MTILKLATMAVVAAYPMGVIQASQIPTLTGIDYAERLTLAGAMMLAVTVLWRSLASKDALVIQFAKTMTEALTAASESNKELRRIIEESVQSKQELAEATRELKVSVDTAMRIMVAVNGGNRVVSP